MTKRSSKLILWALITKLIERSQAAFFVIFPARAGGKFHQKDFSTVKKSKLRTETEERFQPLAARFTLTADLPLRAELFVDEGKAGKFVLVDAADDVVGNGRQHRLLAREFRVEIYCVACASLKVDKKNFF